MSTGGWELPDVSPCTTYCNSLSLYHRCRYYVSTKQSFIKLYPDNRRTPSIFDVAGQECDSIVECPFRGVGEEDECNTDKLKASCSGSYV